MSVVAEVAAELVAALGHSAEVHHRHNHTGTAKLSYVVRVGDKRLWAKVAADPDESRRLATWASVASLLSERHVAPPVLDVMAVNGRTALLFPYIDAPPPTRQMLRARYQEARALLAGLHADVELAGLLGPPTTTATSFRGIWVERFTKDLEVIDGCVSAGLWTFLAEEVETLGAAIDGLEGLANAPVHGDPWWENFLLAPDRLWLLDWDGLAIGDPIVDMAILRHSTLGTDQRYWPRTPADQIARRALMLDAVVDGAADWVENSDPQVRRQKEIEYLSGLDAYRREFC